MDWASGWQKLRSIYIASDIDNNLSSQVIQQLYGFAAHSTDPITLYVMTNGGDCLFAFALIEAMKRCPAPVHTLALGRCFSAGLLVYLAGTRRLAYPNTLFMAHDFNAGPGPYRKLQTMGDWIEQKIMAHFQRYTNLTADTIREKLLGSEFYFDEQEALAMGMVDEIVYAN